MTDARGVSAACSRSSSRSSGFDENASTVTDCGLLPVTLAHAHDDRRPEMTSPETAEGAASAENATATTNQDDDDDDDDADSSKTLRIIADKNNNDDVGVPTACDENRPPGGDSRREDGCSGRAEKADDARDANMEELSRQIENMSARFDTLYARVKAARPVSYTHLTLPTILRV